MDYKGLMRAVGVVPTVTHNCPSCSAPAKCEIMQGKNSCWCFNVQSKGLEMDDVCLCKKCLTSLPD